MSACPVKLTPSWGKHVCKACGLQRRSHQDPFPSLCTRMVATYTTISSGPPKDQWELGNQCHDTVLLGRRCQFCNHAQLSLSADCPRTGLLYIRKGRMHARHLTRMRCAPKIYQTPTYNLSLLPRKQVHEQAQPGMSKSNSYSSAGRRLAYFRFLSRANHGS